MDDRISLRIVYSRGGFSIYLKDNSGNNIRIGSCSKHKENFQDSDRFSCVREFWKIDGFERKFASMEHAVRFIVELFASNLQKQASDECEQALSHFES